MHSLLVIDERLLCALLARVRSAPHQHFAVFADRRGHPASRFPHFQPHINLVFPYVDAGADSDLEAALERALSSIAPFELELKSFSLFASLKGPVNVHLEPSVASANAMRELIAVIDGCLPPALAGKQRRPFKGHLTVGQWPSRDASAALRKLNRKWSTVAWECCEVCLLSRDGVDGRMTVGKIIALSGQRAVAVAPASSPVAGDTALELVWSPLVPNYGLLRGTVAPATKAVSSARAMRRPPAGKVKLVLVLDRSGSMAGSPHKAICAGLDGVENLMAEVPNLETTMIFYNTRAEVVGLVPKGTASQVAARYQPGYQTNFEVALDAVRRSADPGPHDHVRVLFMTDGCANVGDSERGLARFSAWARQCSCAAVVVDVMAFKETGSVLFLDKIREAGTQPGIYRFCTSSTVLAEMLNDVFDTVGCAAMSRTAVGAVALPAGMSIVGTATDNDCPSSWPTDEQTGLGSVSLWVSKPSLPTGADAENAVIQVSLGEASVSVPVRCLGHGHGDDGTAPSAKLDGGAIYGLMLAYVERRIFELCGVDTGLAMHEEAQALQALLKKCEMVFRDRSVGKATRTALLERKQEAQSRLDKLHDLVQQGARRSVADTNKLLSEMQSLRFDGAVKSARRQRALHCRAIKNGDSSDWVARQLAELDYDDAELPQDEESLDFFSCMLTCEDITELMADGDDQVLGFGLCVRRSEEVVDAPSLIQIADISTSLMSRSAMLDAIRFKLSIDNQESVHGGFDMRGQLGVATVGRSREPINTWLPLYICEAHWQRVKLLMQPTLGFFCCMDPLAYDDQQLWVMMLVLGTMATQASAASFGQRELKLLLCFRETCRALVRDDLVFAGKVSSKLANFVKDPAARLKDTVTNLVTLVGGMLVVEPDVARQLSARGFWSLLQVESLRRSCGILLKHRAEGTVGELSRRILGVAAECPALSSDNATAAVERLGAIIGHDKLDPSPVFQGWTASGSGGVGGELDGSGAGAGAAGAADHPLTLKQSAARMLAKYGWKLQRATPGPNIAAKEARAEELARAWWDDAVAKAEAAVSSIDEVRLLTTADAVAACDGLLQQLARVQRISVGGFAAAETVIDLILSSDDLKEGQPLASAPPLMEALRTRRIGPKQSFLWVLLRASACPVDPIAVLRRLQCVLLQCVIGHSNKVARAMVGRGDWVDLGSPTFVADAPAPTIARVTEAITSQRAAIATGQLMNKIGAILACTQQLDTFIGLLALAYETRGTAYNELLRRLTDTSADVALRGDKAEVMLTGRWQGEKVFASGNPSLPGGDLAKSLEDAIGLDRLAQIVVSVRSRVCLAHQYRPSDIANRHGHCNSNPHLACGCAACRAS